ncbi:hypothetical protein P8452_37889 [Trifolium repens]|nr:hypothetical protein P8452_37889 [Trifolium repens]
MATATAVSIVLQPNTKGSRLLLEILIRRYLYGVDLATATPNHRKTTNQILVLSNALFRPLQIYSQFQQSGEPILSSDLFLSINLRCESYLWRVIFINQLECFVIQFSSPFSGNKLKSHLIVVMTDDWT